MTFIEQNKDNLIEIFKEGQSVVIIGNTGDGKISILEAIKNLWVENIPDESLYEACIDIESISSARILVDCKEKISYLTADYDSIKYAQRYLSTDLHIAQHMSLNGKHFGLLATVYPMPDSEEETRFTQESARECALNCLAQLLTGAQLDMLKENGIRVVYCDKNKGHVLL